MWLARDKNDELWLHGEKPIKFQNQWCSTGKVELIKLMDESFFSEIKWSDKKPRELILK